MTENFAAIIGSHGMQRLHGQTVPYVPTPDAKFPDNSIVRVRRLKHLRHLPEVAAVVCCVPAGVSPDHVWADYRGVERPFMCQVPARVTMYLIAFEGRPAPQLIRESELLASEGEAVISFAASPTGGE